MLSILAVAALSQMTSLWENAAGPIIHILPQAGGRYDVIGEGDSCPPPDALTFCLTNRILERTGSALDRRPRPEG